METVMGPLPGPQKRVPLDVKTSETHDEPEFTRMKLTFQAEPGDRVPAYLFVPKGRQGKRPAMLCLHQTTGIGKGEPAGLGGRNELHYAL
jgi:cephalosporin-C deacetylase-like acetyl esterase